MGTLAATSRKARWNRHVRTTKLLLDVGRVLVLLLGIGRAHSPDSPSDCCWVCKPRSVGAIAVAEPGSAKIATKQTDEGVTVEVHLKVRSSPRN